MRWNIIIKWHGREIGDGVKYLGVVKADAYGHGAVQVSRKLEQLGADYLAVASLDEARELRHGWHYYANFDFGAHAAGNGASAHFLPHHTGGVRHGQG